VKFLFYILKHISVSLYQYVWEQKDCTPESINEYIVRKILQKAYVKLQLDIYKYVEYVIKTSRLLRQHDYFEASWTSNSVLDYLQV